MAEWLVEEGIGEHRAVLTHGGQIVAARVDWLSPLRPGAVFDARLVAKPAGARRGTARLDSGVEVLVDNLPREATEGQTIRLRLTRAPIAERGRHKCAQARPAPAGAELSAGPSLLDSLREGDIPVRLCRPVDGRLNEVGWEELTEEAMTGQVSFAGGCLQISPSPAMTVIDIDGPPPARALALAAVPAIAAALARFDIGGSLGIDFPTLSEKTDRQAVDSALGQALADWRGERTAMNGFGFVQLVSRLERPSIVALYQGNPARAALCGLARRAERTQGSGALLIGAHPALKTALPPRFEADLSARIYREIVWQWDEALAIESPWVQTAAP